MRPRLIGSTQLPPLTWIEGIENGWVAVLRDGPTLRLFDGDLRVAADVPLPAVGRPASATASADRSRFAVVSIDGVTVVDRAGRVLWSRAHRFGRAVAVGPHAHLDGTGRLWLYLPATGDAGDTLAVFDAADGREIARTALERDGLGRLVPHPDGRHIGVEVVMGQEGATSFWAHLDGTGIVTRTTAGESLTAIAGTGDWYVDFPRVDDRVTLREFADGASRAACTAAELGGFAPEIPYVFNNGAGALVSDDYLMVGVTAPWDADGPVCGDEDERHLLLSTRRLRPVATIEYGEPMTLNSLRDAGGRGRWLTHVMDSGTVRLWGLPESATEMDGQLPAF